MYSSKCHCGESVTVLSEKRSCNQKMQSDPTVPNKPSFSNVHTPWATAPEEGLAAGLHQGAPEYPGVCTRSAQAQLPGTPGSGVHPLFSCAPPPGRSLW